ncbi:uncharacterized protein LOC121978412 [Zingiber officinale]|uniref:uncharacterized protein LOC121978412 n=1 Tax=Zingiber officinale TaxID=94328 RepID=UPI001C4C677C|nr:uncharacterized protein LOC121978412 [Zingiber officinale]
MQNVEGDANCIDIDELISDVDSDDDDYEAQTFPLLNPIKDAENSDLQLTWLREKLLKWFRGLLASNLAGSKLLCRVDEGRSKCHNHLKLTEDEDGSTFQRMYVYFSACKEGFKKACRPLVGVDECFLKSKNGGQLLAAVGLDPNNNIFPICYALVERETKDSWMWFLQLLDPDIGIGDGHRWTFMSYKQKGLILAFKRLFPAAENCFCIRHLHSNMKREGFPGMSIRNSLWTVAKATTIAEFRHRMEEMKQIDVKVYEWLAKKPKEHWSKSHFTITPKSDALLNNMCKCLNSFILEAREKPIILMFEVIRNLLIVRFQLHREKVEK